MSDKADVHWRPIKIGCDLQWGQVFNQTSGGPWFIEITHNKTHSATDGPGSFINIGQ